MANRKFRFQETAFIFPVLLALAELVTYLSNDAYLPGLPHIARDLGTTHHMVQLSLTTWFIGSAAIQPILGPLCDRLGRRPVILTGGIFFVLSTIACALATTGPLLVFFRLIQGATVAPTVIAGYSTIHEMFEQKEAIHTIAMMNAITLIAPSFGPLIGAIILYFTDWRWLFGILAITSGLVYTGIFFKMPETKPESLEPQSISTICKQYKAILTNKRFMLLNIIFLCLFATMIAWITLGPFLLVDKFHFTSLDFGLTQALIFGGFIIGTRLVKPIMKRFEPWRLITLGVTLAMIGGVYVLVTALIWPMLLRNAIAGMVCLAFGSGLIFPVLNRLSIESSEEPMGSKVAISSFMMGIAGATGSLLSSTVYNGTILSLGLIMCVLSVLSFCVEYFV